MQFIAETKLEKLLQVEMNNSKFHLQKLKIAVKFSFPSFNV